MTQTGKEVRSRIREGLITGPTSGMAPGYVQANLAILPRDWAFDFLLFAQRNPKPCPIIEAGDPGNHFTRFCADQANICTDIPKYRIYRNGEMTEEMTDITKLWREDFVYFLLGCSFSFEDALIKADLKIRHMEENVNVPMYKTSIMCHAAGKFKETPMVVSMRPFKAKDAIKAVEITRDYPYVHGSPVHMGNPAEIGITDLSSPDFGDPVTVRDDEIPVFWACGVTPQMAAMVARPPLMITHAPGHMFIGDKKDYEFKL
ncbi:MAG: putative hydro-lyase [Desulfobacteraceae bacterium]|nr:putative hydro-lyase [Desulfobacteraceae bacterium]